jgi:hypothetical protein
MRRLLIGLLALGSYSCFAFDFSIKCTKEGAFFTRGGDIIKMADSFLVPKLKIGSETSKEIFKTDANRVSLFRNGDKVAIVLFEMKEDKIVAAVEYKLVNANSVDVIINGANNERLQMTNCSIKKN